MQLPYSNLQIYHQNPGATMPLKMNINVICNTSDEDIYCNIHENSRRPGEWLKLSDEHEGVAILCGSGPSLADGLKEIKEKQEAGGKVFAMNGAAKYLNDHGIMPDYQVMIDARIETADLVGPAKEHLFSSQVHPECFNRVGNAKVWHLQIGNIEQVFPEYNDDYVLIGGAASVGNTATCLAYAMGYRKLEIYGYDSSHREQEGEPSTYCGYDQIGKYISHAFDQPLNNGDPCASVKFMGKDYICSLTMKLQAEKFQETSKALIDAGCIINVHGTGLLPDMFNAKNIELTEQQKYKYMWDMPVYRQFSPGARVAEKFIEISGVKNGDIVIDFGCGSGKGAKRINELAGCEFILVDFADNSLDEDVMNGRWHTRYRHDLTKPLQVGSEYGFCTDVMEHIPPEDVDKVIQNIMSASRKVFFQISLVDDVHGELIGHPLHLSVHNAEWWKDKFGKLGHYIEYMGSNGREAIFYVHTNEKYSDYECVSLSTKEIEM